MKDNLSRWWSKLSWTRKYFYLWFAIWILIILHGCALMSPSPQTVVKSAECKSGVDSVEYKDTYNNWFAVVVGTSERTVSVKCRGVE